MKTQLVYEQKLPPSEPIKAAKDTTTSHTTSTKTSEVNPLETDELKVAAPVLRRLRDYNFREGENFTSRNIFIRQIERTPLITVYKRAVIKFCRKNRKPRTIKDQNTNSGSSSKEKNNSRHSIHTTAYN